MSMCTNAKVSSLVYKVNSLLVPNPNQVIVGTSCLSNTYFSVCCKSIKQESNKTVDTTKYLERLWISIAMKSCYLYYRWLNKAEVRIFINSIRSKIKDAYSFFSAG